MSYASQIQGHRAHIRETLRERVAELGVAAGKPIEITDDVLNDIAIVFMLGMLSGEEVGQAFAVAYQVAFAVQNEE